MKSAQIATICDASPMGALVIPRDTPLKNAIEQFAQDPTLHGIFVTDKAGRLGGVVNNHDLLDWARLQFDLLSRDFLLPVGKVRRLLTAKTIGDLAIPDSHKMAVTLTSTLSDALRLMARHELEDVAVVDETGRIINDLRLSEVLLAALRVSAENNP